MSRGRCPLLQRDKEPFLPLHTHTLKRQDTEIYNKMKIPTAPAWQKAKSVFLTLGADFAYFFHVVFGAVVDGVGNPALGDGLVFGG